MKRRLIRITSLILSLTIFLISSAIATAQTTTDTNLQRAISLGIGASPSGKIYPLYLIRIEAPPV